MCNGQCYWKRRSRRGRTTRIWINWVSWIKRKISVVRINWLCSHGVPELLLLKTFLKKRKRISLEILRGAWTFSPALGRVLEGSSSSSSSLVLFSYSLDTWIERVACCSVLRTYRDICRGQSVSPLETFIIWSGSLCFCCCFVLHIKYEIIH